MESTQHSPARFTVIVPCYNEENGILGTLQMLRQHLREAGPYELVVVNDGSTDRSGEVLRQAAADDATLRVIDHVVNRGYGAALKTAIRHCRTELIVITDADGTYPNERIAELVDACQDIDMVVGARVGADVQYPFIRRVPKVFLRRYSSWLARQNIPDINSGLRVFRRDIAEKFIHILPNGFSFTTTITLAMLTNYYAVKFIPIGYKARIGKSKIKPIRDTLKFMQLIVRTGMYFAPMRLLMPPAGLCFLAFLISIGFDVYQKDLTEKTMLLLMVTLNLTLVGLLGDMIDKRSNS